MLLKYHPVEKWGLIIITPWSKVVITANPSPFRPRLISAQRIIRARLGEYTQKQKCYIIKIIYN